MIEASEAIQVMKRGGVAVRGDQRVILADYGRVYRDLVTREEVSVGSESFDRVEMSPEDQAREDARTERLEELRGDRDRIDDEIGRLR